MAVAKTENYPADVLERLIQRYHELRETDPKVTETLAAEFNRPKRSIISKLSREGQYVKPEKPVKAAKDEGPTKKELLNELEGLVSFDVTGLMPATKEAIASVIKLAKGA